MESTRVRACAERRPIITRQDVEYVRTLIYCTQLLLCGLFNWLSSGIFHSSLQCSKIHIVTLLVLWPPWAKRLSKSAQNLLRTTLIVTLRGAFQSLHRNGPCRGSGGSSWGCHYGGPCSIPGQWMWNLWSIKTAVAQDFLWVFRSPAVSFIAPMPHTHLFINYRCLAV
jgi:hypothetical protein